MVNRLRKLLFAYIDLSMVRITKRHKMSTKERCLTIVPTLISVKADESKIPKIKIELHKLRSDIFFREIKLKIILK
jgi:hypothetical protein